MIKHIFLILLLLMTLFSCNKNHKPSNINQFEYWNDVSTWGFTGKMAINDSHNSGSGKVDWFVTENTITAKFKAPLGQGSWEISENNNQAQLISSKNGTRLAKNAESLISHELGWYFPWNNLQYWLRGYTPNDKLKTHDNLTKVLHHDGWEITYQKWIVTPIGWLPRKIKASKPPYSVKLIVYNWDIQ